MFRRHLIESTARRRLSQMSHCLKAFVVLYVVVVLHASAVNSENDQLIDNNTCGTHLKTVTSCIIPNQNVKGICVMISRCSAYRKVRNIFDLTPEKISFLRHVQCPVGDDGDLEVCCPVDCSDYINPEIDFTGLEVVPFVNFTRKWKQKKHKRRIQKVQDASGLINECGKQITNRIYGGEIAELDEFPWMALIMYNSNEFGCSAVLLNKRYVLTAAHCVRGPIVREKKGLKFIRLGEFNTKTQPDCIEESNFLNCADAAIDVAIDKVIVHPDYDEYSSNKPNDIALIRLRNTVQMTHFIMPICLPDPKEEEDPFVSGRQFSVAGWGRTDLFNKYFDNIRSPIKLKLRVPIILRENCTKILEPYGFQLAPTQICAGGEKAKDTCAGDSGGPLMYFDRKNSRWVTYGIVSYGFTECGLAGHPAVYTNVVPYVDWIQSIIQL